MPRPNAANGLPGQTLVTALTDGKDISGAVANPEHSAFPIIVAEWERNSREVIRVALDFYEGRHTINVRVWFRDGDDLKPGRAGITLAVKHLPALADALNSALADARGRGLLPAEGRP